jgi:hypothetical protein
LKKLSQIEEVEKKKIEFLLNLIIASFKEFYKEFGQSTQIIWFQLLLFPQKLDQNFTGV